MSGRGSSSLLPLPAEGGIGGLWPPSWNADASHRLRRRMRVLSAEANSSIRLTAAARQRSTFSQKGRRGRDSATCAQACSPNARLSRRIEDRRVAVGEQVYGEYLHGSAGLPRLKNGFLDRDSMWTPDGVRRQSGPCRAAFRCRAIARTGPIRRVRCFIFPSRSAGGGGLFEPRLSAVFFVFIGGNTPYSCIIFDVFLARKATANSGSIVGSALKAVFYEKGIDHEQLQGDLYLLLWLL